MNESGKDSGAAAPRCLCTITKHERQENRACPVHARRPATAPEYCDRCDGCGWYEGGKTLKATCEKCGGTGVTSGTAPLAAPPALHVAIDQLVGAIPLPDAAFFDNVQKLETDAKEAVWQAAARRVRAFVPDPGTAAPPAPLLREANKDQGAAAQAERPRVERVYLSSSWKNRDRVRELATKLRVLGHEVYDFTDPRDRDGVPEIPPERFPQKFDPEHDIYSAYIDRPEWRGAVERNRKALDWCTVAVLLLPAGNDAHADWAFAVGAGKRTAVVGHPPAGERTPTHLWGALLDCDADVFDWLEAISGQPAAGPPDPSPSAPPAASSASPAVPARDLFKPTAAETIDMLASQRRRHEPQVGFASPAVPALSSGARQVATEAPAAPLDLSARVKELEGLLGKLVKAMQTWGRWEDGIPDEFFASWLEARSLLSAAETPANQEAGAGPRPPDRGGE